MKSEGVFAQGAAVDSSLILLIPAALNAPHALCPQGIVTGSFSRSRQTGHMKESSSFFLFFEIASAILFAFSYKHMHTK